MGCMTTDGSYRLTELFIHFVRACLHAHTGALEKSEDSEAPTSDTLGKPGVALP